MITSEILTKSSHDEQPILNTSENRMKSSHGGKRPGAGRPRRDDSIRAVVEQAVELAARLSYTPHEVSRESFTKYEVARDAYIREHAHPLVHWLAFAQDFDKRNKTLISKHRAFVIAHLDEQSQFFFLYHYCENALRKAEKQHFNDSYQTERGYARWCTLCLQNEGEMPPKKPEEIEN